MIMIQTFLSVTPPRPQHPNLGLLLFSFDTHCCAHPTPEHSRHFSQSLNKYLEKIIIDSNALDLQSLCILSGRWVWKVKVEAVVIRDGGNVEGVIANGVVMALADVRKPVLTIGEGGTLVCSGKVVTSDWNIPNQAISNTTNSASAKSKPSIPTLPLGLTHLPLTYTFLLHSSYPVLDPSYSECLLSYPLFIISINVFKELCGLKKEEGTGIAAKVTNQLIKFAQNHIVEDTKSIREILAKRAV